MSNKNKTFLLGLGAQKSGTTWLHHYLEQFNHVDNGMFKEYHVWDVMTHPACRTSRVKWWKYYRTRHRALYRMQRNPALYFDHFERLLKNKNITLAADITPCYSCLSHNTLRKIKTGFADKNIAVKIVFFMRDPIERCWSAVRMYQKHNFKRFKDVKGIASLPVKDALRRYYKTEGAKIRTQYEQTIRAVEDTFPAEDIHYEIYEQLFTPTALHKLCTFLNLEERPELLSKKHNATNKETEISEQLCRDVAAEYKETYKFCAQRFPETKNLWGGFQYLQ